MNLTEQKELFLAHLSETGSVVAASEACGFSAKYGYQLQRELAEVIVERAREKLAGSALKAVNTAVEMMDADSGTEQAQVRLAAAEKVMDRVGLTKHTSVEVKVESQNGLFILPAKATVDPESDSNDVSDVE